MEAKERRKLIKPRELLVLVIVMLVALAAIFALRNPAIPPAPESSAPLASSATGIYGGDPDIVYAVVRYGNEIIAVYPLDENITVASEDLGLPTFHVEMQILDGKAAFIHSECPDQVCVDTGWLSLEHDFAACLPANISIFLETSIEYDV